MEEDIRIRKAALGDIEEIAEIYAYAREAMRRAGNPGQWGQHYPPRQIIEADILNGNSYVVTDKGVIGAVFVFVVGQDPTYQRIENGEWLNQDAYGTIHRMAGNGRIKGVFRLCQQFCESKISNIRADTHKCNVIMQRLLERSGYQRCGQIYVADGSPRIAYQKVL